MYLYYAGMVMVLVLAPAAIRSEPQQAQQKHSHIDEIVEEINQMRREKGLHILKYSSKLESSAQVQSTYQAEMGQMTHDNPISIAGRMLIAGFSVQLGRAGENVGKEKTLNGKVMVDTWKSSPGHLANMMHPLYDYIGVSVIKSRWNGMWYWTAHFAQSTFGGDTEPRNPVSVKCETQVIVDGSVPSSSLIIDINHLIQGLMATKTDHSMEATTLFNRASEFTPPTITFTQPAITQTELSTVSYVSTEYIIPTTIVIPLSSPSASRSGRSAMPHMTTISDTFALTLTTSLVTTFTTSFATTLTTSLNATPSFRSSKLSSHTPTKSTGTVLILSNTSVLMTTTLPPNTKPNIPLVRPTRVIRYRCRSHKTTPTVHVTTVYKCPRKAVK